MIKLLLFTVIFTIMIILGTVIVLPRFFRFARVYYKDYPVIGHMWGRPSITEGLRSDGCDMEQEWLDNSSNTTEETANYQIKYDECMENQVQSDSYNSCNKSGCEIKMDSCKIIPKKGTNTLVFAADCSYICVDTSGECLVDTDCSKCGINKDGRDYLTLFDEIMGSNPLNNNTPHCTEAKCSTNTSNITCGEANGNADLSLNYSLNTDYSQKHDQLAIDAELFNYGILNDDTVDSVDNTEGNNPNNIKDSTTLNNSQYIGSTNSSTTVDFPINNSVTGLFNTSGPCGHNQDQYVREEDGF
jgi:hypothetical protein